MADDKIKQFPGTKPEKSLADITREIEQNMPRLLAMLDVQMRVTRAAYEAARQKGFTDEQAMELAKVAYMQLNNRG